MSAVVASPSQPIVEPKDRPWTVVYTLAQRELVRFFRQRNRVVGAVGQPIILWLLFGAGLGPSFRLPGAGENGMSYREFFFPGTMSLILLFTAIFTTISIIEDRREGFLQSVLVAPISRWSLVLGKLLGGSLIALIQALIFFALGLTLEIHFPFALSTVLFVALFAFLSAFALTALGFLIAWRMDSTQGFHAVMSVFLLPMWLLSGSFFPGEGWLRWVMLVNPMTYMTAGLRQLMYLGGGALTGEPPPLPPHLPGLGTCWLVTFGFALLLFAADCKLAARRTTGDLL
jgi:ABC-2 type transport system permease protein